MKHTFKLTDSLIGINKLGTYHGYMNPDHYFDSYSIDQDFEEGYSEYNAEEYWDKHFSWDVYTDLIVKQIDNQLHLLISEINDYLAKYHTAEVFPILSIDCVGIDSPKYYNYRDHQYLLDFEVNYSTFKTALWNFSNENNVDFEKFLKANYSSCSGFISYTSNNYKDWEREFSADNDQEIGAVLSYLINEHLDFDFIEYCLQNFEIHYSECTK